MSDRPEVLFNVPTLEGRELEHVADAMRSGHGSTGGPYSQQAAAMLQEATTADPTLSARDAPSSWSVQETAAALGSSGTRASAAASCRLRVVDFFTVSPWIVLECGA